MIRVGNDASEKILFDTPQLPASYFKFNFKDWEVNEAAGNVVDLSTDKITINTFRPNIWIARSKPITGIANKAICNYCKGAILSTEGISQAMSGYKYDNRESNNHGAGNDTPRFTGFCIYPMDERGRTMQETMYTWEQCWDSSTTRNNPSVADWGEFRIGGGGHGLYGSDSDITNKIVFPRSLYDFPSNYRGSSKTWYYGIFIANGDVLWFGDRKWEIYGGGVEGDWAVLTVRLNEGASGWSLCKWAEVPSNKIEVKGLQEGDRLEYGLVNTIIGKSDRSITQDGTYSFNNFGNGSQGASFKLYSTNPSSKSPVKIRFVNEKHPTGLITSKVKIIQPNPKGVDVSTTECWKMFLGDNLAYLKDRTIDNCWKEYCYCFPENYNTTFNNFIAPNENITILSPNKIRINKRNSENYEFTMKPINHDSPSVKVDYRKCVIKVSGLGDRNDVTLIARRSFDNSTELMDVNLPLNEGMNTLDPMKATIYRAVTGTPIGCHELGFQVVGTGTGKDESVNIIVELIPQYLERDHNDYPERMALRVYPNNQVYGLSPSSQLPHVKDFKDKIDQFMFPYWATSDNGISEEIANWYKNNTCTHFNRGKIFCENGNLKEIHIKLSGDQFGYGESNFTESAIETLTFETTGPNSHISSPQRILQSAKKLKTINLKWYQDKPNFLCGANSIVDGMSYLLELQTYPNRFINWGAYRSNAGENTIPCTLFHSAFHDSRGLTEIPSYPGTEDENTIRTNRHIEDAFKGCTNLVTIGPTLDLILVEPMRSYGVFLGCDNLTNAKIINLNHGNWYLDGVERLGMIHGNLSKLNPSDAENLISSVADLTTHDPIKHEDGPSKSFNYWDTEYKDFVTEWTDDWEYGFMDSISKFSFRKRLRSTDRPAPIISTAANFGTMEFTISGLSSGDIIGWGNNMMMERTFDTNGNFTITKSDTSRKGFVLLNNTNQSSKAIVTISIKNALDYRNPNVSKASLYLPGEWIGKIDTGMIADATGRGWDVFLGGKQYF